MPPSAHDTAIVALNAQQFGDLQKRPTCSRSSQHDQSTSQQATLVGLSELQKKGGDLKASNAVAADAQYYGPLVGAGHKPQTILQG